MLIFLVYDPSHADVLREEHCNIIVTFAMVKRIRDMSQYDAFVPVLPKGFPKILIDSGGYQLQTGVKTSMNINTHEYGTWLRDATVKFPEIFGYFNLDTLGDINTTLDNQGKLENMGLNPIPVWHPGESDWLLEYYCSEYDYVAVGGVAGGAGKKLKLNSERLRYVFERILPRYPKTKFHALGVGIGASTMFRTYRPYSVDFSTWVNTYKFGHGLVWDKDGLLREQELPKDVRDRIRWDKKFKKDIVRDTIEKINIFAERIELMEDSHQHQFEVTI